MKTIKQFLSLLCMLLLAITSLEAQAQSADKYSDPEIAAIAVAANKIDISYAKIAKEKSDNEQIIGFANTMLSDHNAVIKKAVNLVKELGVKPQSNEFSEKLNNDAKKTRKMLHSKSGSEFNEAYITNEVKYHEAVINAIENVLIPDTENGQLKELLKNVVPALKAHLEQAKSVKDDITSSSGY